jgi:predicted deacylase
MISLLSYFKKAPEFSVWNSHPNQVSKILITAGIDGDEYQSIKTAKMIISNYKLDVPITVIPIVNIAGYQAKTSYNPLDGHFPKHIFPGSSFGSSSSRLMNQISRYTAGKKIWIDLHCGALGETLFPFIWAPFPYPILSYLDKRILVENSINKGIPYVIFESGSASWVYKIINNIDKPAKNNWQPTYTKINYARYSNQKVTKDTLWYSKSIFVTAS